MTYDDIAQQYEQYRATAAVNAGKPYFPNVTVGWDSSPRACQTDTLIAQGYPFTAVIEGNTPQKFGHYLESAKAFLDASGNRNKILTVNSWNEWTEGSYLEPDTEHRLGYLEQIERVFRR